MLFALNPTIAWFTNTMWIETSYIFFLVLVVVLHARRLAHEPVVGLRRVGAAPRERRVVPRRRHVPAAVLDPRGRVPAGRRPAPAIVVAERAAPVAPRRRVDGHRGARGRALLDLRIADVRRVHGDRRHGRPRVAPRQQRLPAAHVRLRQRHVDRVALRADAGHGPPVLQPRRAARVVEPLRGPGSREVDPRAPGHVRGPDPAPPRPDVEPELLPHPPPSVGVLAGNTLVRQGVHLRRDRRVFRSGWRCSAPSAPGPARAVPTR
jgi:hypothetical protein